MVLNLWAGGDELDYEFLEIRPYTCPRISISLDRERRMLLFGFGRRQFWCDITELNEPGWAKFHYTLNQPRGWYAGTVQVPCHEEYQS